MGAAPLAPALLDLPRALHHPAVLDPSALDQLDPRRHHLALSGFPASFLARQRPPAAPDIHRWTELPDADAEAAFLEVCRKHEGLNVHWLHRFGEPEADMTVVWKRTQGEGDAVAAFVRPATAACTKEPTCVHAAAVRDAAAWGPRVGVLGGAPGLGKSCFLRHLAAEARARAPHHWALLLQALDHRHLLEKFPQSQALTKDHVVELLEAAAGVATQAVGAEGAAEAARSYLRAALDHTGAIAVFIDGVDEVCPAYMQKLLKLLQLLLATQVKRVWVASRPEAAWELSRELRCPPSSLRPFSEAEQESFLCRVWASADAAGRAPAQFAGLAADTVTALRSAAGRGRRSLLEVPLHAQMAAEATAQQAAQALDGGRCLLLSGLSLHQLYRLFVRQKRHLFRRRFGLDDANFANLAIADNFLEIHSNCAMFVLISGGGYDSVNLEPFTDYLDKNREILTKERTGILWLQQDGMPRFLHYTFVEYFAVNWILHEGSSETVKQIWLHLLDQPIDAQVRQHLEHMLSEGLPLHQAVLDGSEAALEATSCNPNASDRFGRTALHQAASLGRVGAVGALLAKGSDMGLEDKVLGWTALRYASACGQLPAAERLLEAGAEPTDFVTDDMKLVAVHAAELGCTKIMHILLMRGLQANCCRMDENMLIFLAVKNGQKETVNLLLKNKGNVNGHIKYDNTFLYMGNICRQLISTISWENRRKIDPISIMKKTPLIIAATNDDAAGVVLLLELGADVNECDTLKFTALHFATMTGHHQITKILLDHNANPNAKDYLKTTSLLYAAEAGDVTSVSLLLQHGADVNHGNLTGFTALHLAASNVKHEVIKILLDNKANPNSTNGHGSTPLICAADRGDVDSVALLLQHGADVNQRDGENLTPLHLASSNVHHEMIKVLLDNNANTNATDDHGRTSLMLSVIRDDPASVFLHIEHGADVNHCCKNNLTALHYAFCNGHHDIIQILLDNKANPNIIDTDNLTPLMYAVVKGDAVSVSFLLQSGADVNQCNGNNLTALHYASFNDHQDITKILLDNNATPNAVDKDNETPLMFAVKDDRAISVKFLLQRGADVNQCNKWNWTALHFASYYRRNEIVEILFHNITNPSDIDKQNNTGLMSAAKDGDAATVLLLLQHGVDVNQCDWNEWTALHYSCIKGHHDVLKLLLDHNANADTTDEKMRTPLMIAAIKGDAASAVLLLEHGADVNQCDLVMWTALHYASMNGHHEVTKILLDHNANPNATDKRKRTSLMFGARNGDAASVRHLLRHGAKVNLRDTSNKTALCHATCNDGAEIVDLLIEMGVRESLSVWSKMVNMLRKK